MIIERALVHLVLQQGKAIFCTMHTNNEQPSVLVTVHGNDTCLSRQLMCKITATSPRMLMASSLESQGHLLLQKPVDFVMVVLLVAHRATLLV